MISDSAVESLAFSRVGLYESVLNMRFVMSAAGGLAARAVPLYYVQDLCASGALPQQGAQSGVYCVASLQQQRRLAVTLFQSDYVTCAVTDLCRPYKVSLPVYVSFCDKISEQAVMASFIRVYAALRLVAVQRVVMRLLLDYYTYLDNW